MINGLAARAFGFMCMNIQMESNLSRDDERNLVVMMIRTFDSFP